MGFIYKVDNQITGKSYIGQTSKTVLERWLRHIRESNAAIDGRRQSFPLFHRMIIKYGVENFKCYSIEECDNNKLDEREQYWIQYYDTFNNGYNGTIGGQKQFSNNIGRQVSCYTLDGDFIKTFNNVAEASKEYKIHPSNIRKNCNGISKTCANRIWKWGNQQEKIIIPTLDVKKKQHSIPVLQLTLTGEVIAKFDSMLQAAKLTNVSYAGIQKVCKGKQKTAGGYLWKQNLI